jgi:hypothetical protein
MTNPFDHESDARLGRLLREGLGVPEHDDFVHRTRALLAAEPRRSSWDVLGTWLRPGLVAAAMLALAFSMWLRLAPAAPTEGSLVAAAVRSAGMPNALLPSSQASSSDYLLAAAVEGR